MIISHFFKYWSKLKRNPREFFWGGPNFVNVPVNLSIWVDSDHTVIYYQLYDHNQHPEEISFRKFRISSEKCYSIKDEDTLWCHL